jgi:hypothetical protein
MKYDYGITKILLESSNLRIQCTGIGGNHENRYVCALQQWYRISQKAGYAIIKMLEEFYII